MKYRTTILISAALISGTVSASAFEIKGTNGTAIEATEIAIFNEPWAMVMGQSGDALITEKSGQLFHLSKDGVKTEIKGVPEVFYGGQGGLGDVIFAGDAEDEIYLSYVEQDADNFGAVVVKAKLESAENGKLQLADIARIWEQNKQGRQGHYSHKLAIGPDSKLYITSGDRQMQKPAQDMSVNLGKVIRLNLDGSVPEDNPFQSDGEIAKTFWTIGHRNLLGIAFGADGKLWTHEMGPRHGDELNLIEKGENYGWPLVSNGDNYSGIPIPDHESDPKFNAPQAFWVPTIAPSGLVIYNGDQFADWNGAALIGGLASQALIHVDINGTSATENERFEWGSRVREVEQGTNGEVYVLEDGPEGRLLKLEPNG
ncbi:PQQ-dependent sugar dehydrogenase [Ahrensia sp. 13_GOM-1096m]|uniref:PQQ-dependent sugar dehydrogenase n=1 Tax=Ahrensia sp. 13_GOM-1096m TaxID=1380380 RepID=UPI00047BBC53|nr:PQQ-dependent sugar dehydrogenase [Ahrensia sp. 13_GOM-1096m]